MLVKEYLNDIPLTTTSFKIQYPILNTQFEIAFNWSKYIFDNPLIFCQSIHFHLIDISDNSFLTQLFI